MLRNKSLCRSFSRRKKDEKPACTQDYYAKMRAIQNKYIGQQTGSTENHSIVLVPFHVCEHNAYMNQTYSIFVAVFNFLDFAFWMVEAQTQLKIQAMVLHLEMRFHQVLKWKRSNIQLCLALRSYSPVQLGPQRSFFIESTAAFLVWVGNQNMAKNKTK